MPETVLAHHYTSPRPDPSHFEADTREALSVFRVRLFSALADLSAPIVEQYRGDIMHDVHWLDEHITALEPVTFFYGADASGTAIGMDERLVRVSRRNVWRVEVTADHEKFSTKVAILVTEIAKDLDPGTGGVFGAMGVLVTIVRSGGLDNAVVIHLDTDFEPDGSDGFHGMRVLINDWTAYEGVKFEPVGVDYVWPAPSGGGWIDAWNGWYADEATARRDAAAGVGTPWVLAHGENLVDQDEADRRRA